MTLAQGQRTATVDGSQPGFASRLLRSRLRKVVPLRLRHGLWSVAQYRETYRLVADWRSFRAFRRLQSWWLPPGQGTVEVRFRQLGGVPVKLRPGTQDDALPRSVFLSRGHLPPPSIATDQLRVIWDLGANVGLTMAHMATLYPDARIVGVELDGENAALCRENLAPWQERCQVINTAVWIADGTVTYERGEGREQSFHIVEDGVSSTDVQAPASSLDTLLARTDTPCIDYVKMDIEGAEARVLKENTSWAERTRSIKVEVHDPYSVEECVSDLSRLGFVATPVPEAKRTVAGIRVE